MRGNRAVVPGPGELVAGLAVGPVDHGRGERERVHGHALGVHLGQPLLGVDELHRQPAVRSGRRLEGERLPVRLELGVEAAAFGIHDVEVALRVIVGVDVDGRHARGRRCARHLRAGAAGSRHRAAAPAAADNRPVQHCRRDGAWQLPQSTCIIMASTSQLIAARLPGFRCRELSRGRVLVKVGITRERQGGGVARDAPCA